MAPRRRPWLDDIAPLFKMQTLPWIVALIALLTVAIGLLTWLVTSRRPARPAPLPAEWALAPRAVFSTAERRLHRLLREAFPHHIVLAKLPLVRFCQATEPDEMRYWYDLLGTTHVTFAVCSANGRVLLALDFDSDRGNSRRSLRIKQAVLEACGVRHERCTADKLPGIAELQLMLPAAPAPQRVPDTRRTPTATTTAATTTTEKPAHDLAQARAALSTTVASRRAERAAKSSDSTVFQDSFFVPDARNEPATSEFAPDADAAPASFVETTTRGAQADGEGGGVVVDTPPHLPLPPR